MPSIFKNNVDFLSFSPPYVYVCFLYNCSNSVYDILYPDCFLSHSLYISVFPIIKFFMNLICNGYIVFLHMGALMFGYLKYFNDFYFMTISECLFIDQITSYTGFIEIELPGLRC